MTYEGMFDEIECKFELERQKKYIQKQASIIFALERELEEKNNEIIIIKGKLKEEKWLRYFYKHQKNYKCCVYFL